MERGMRTMNWGHGPPHKRIISAVKGVEFVSDKTDDVKDSFYGELERIFDKFPKYHMNMPK
jgi:hypothetical protein